MIFWGRDISLLLILRNRDEKEMKDCTDFGLRALDDRRRFPPRIAEQKRLDLPINTLTTKHSSTLRCLK